VLGDLDAGAVQRWFSAALAALGRQQREIDALNVFPVADADTGTNLVMTVQAALDAAGDSEQSARQALTRAARGALLGARGNSGMILSQLMSGLAAALPDQEPVRGQALAAGLRAAAAAGYSAVVEPVEGTMLSVARAAAEAAVDTGTDDLGTVTAAVVKAATVALEGTPAQLAAQGLPGVVDAGGRGLVVVLDALDAVVRGLPISTPARADVLPAGPMPSPAQLAGQRGWEIQYLLDVPAEERIPSLRQRLTEVGDSVVVACADPGSGSGSVWTVHVHSDEIGPAIEAALDAGRPRRISVTPLLERGDERGVVALVPGPGLAAIFTAAGAVPVPAGIAPPSVAELQAAVRRTAARQVVLLANAAANAEVADAVAHLGEHDGQVVSVLHTRSPVQGLAALAVADPHRPFGEDVIAMAEAAAATRWAEIVIADQAAYTIAGECRAGDVLALVDGDVVAVGKDVSAAARHLLDRLLNTGGELVTLVAGAEAAPGLAVDLEDHLHAKWPFCECQVFSGGQAGVLLVGVE
jgi:DAK2 domain fusion protein YloV